MYLKPTITGDEPVDVANYARTHAAFPHESTTEQWFDEPQFESYRMLGLQTALTRLRERDNSRARATSVSRRAEDNYENAQRC